MFSSGNLGEAGASGLLAEVLDDGEIVRKPFVPLSHPSGGNLHRWEELRDELMHGNRWFLEDPMDLERIAVLLSQVITGPSDIAYTPWYRARLIAGDEDYDLKDMGAPPRHKAGHGRANPAGIPYLYLGSTRSTAVAELRPHTGERACVARFELSGASNLKLADLRDPRSLISPFTQGDEGDIIELRADLPLLERLGDELTRPVQPRGVPYEYVPTQYLCECIKKLGFDGVLYRSSVSSDSGVNIALFHPEVAVAVESRNVSVTQVAVAIDG
ncbi:RES family NAD+ phosphorylase [Brevibacterium sp. FAM 27836]|uniref:RES family NAD+ phosphorylase n=1 Tax=Brevibacterium sp. FAM 27836 TaxID=3446693 RepID=UPI003F51545F